LGRSGLWRAVTWLRSLAPAFRRERRSLRFPLAGDDLHDLCRLLSDIRVTVSDAFLNECEEVIEIRPRDPERPSSALSPHARPDRAQLIRVNPQPDRRRGCLHGVRDLLDGHQLVRVHVDGRELPYGITDRLQLGLERDLRTGGCGRRSPLLPS
jgi:hypothetical protein